MPNRGFYVENGIDIIDKDPDSSLDYTRDWTDWLNGDTIAASALSSVGTDIAMTAVNGDTGILTSTSTDFTTNFELGDLPDISGFLTNAVNNGIFRVVAIPTPNSMQIQKVNGDTLIAEASGNSITLTNNPTEWALPAPLFQPKPKTFTLTQATVWIAGGVAGQRYSVTSRIRTAAGRKDEISFTVNVLQK